MFDAVNGLNALQNILQRIVYRIFPRFQRQALVTHILQCDDFPAHFLLRQLFSCNMLVFRMVRAVLTAVNAIVGQIQRRKHYDAVPVKFLLDLFRQLVNFLVFFFQLTIQQHDRLFMGKPFHFFRFF